MEPRPLPEALLSMKEVASRLGVCRAVAYRFVARGELPHYRISNAIKVALSDLEAFAATRKR